jgi:hypothetical protein
MQDFGGFPGFSHDFRTIISRLQAFPSFQLYIFPLESPGQALALFRFGYTSAVWMRKVPLGRWSSSSCPSAAPHAGRGWEGWDVQFFFHFFLDFGEFGRWFFYTFWEIGKIDRLVKNEKKVRKL